MQAAASVIDPLKILRPMHCVGIGSRCRLERDGSRGSSPLLGWLLRWPPTN